MSGNASRAGRVHRPHPDGCRAASDPGHAAPCSAAQCSCPDL